MEWIILILVGVGLFAVVQGPFRSSLRILPAPTWCVGVALTVITMVDLPLWADLCTLWLVLLIGGRWHQARMRRERRVMAGEVRSALPVSDRSRLQRGPGTD